MTHSETSPNKSPDSDRKLIEELDDLEEFQTIPKAKPRLSRQAALLAHATESDGSRNVQSKDRNSKSTQPSSSSAISEISPNLSDNEAGSDNDVSRAESNEEEKVTEKKEDTKVEEKSIKSRMKSFLSSSSFSKRKKSKQLSTDIAEPIKQASDDEDKNSENSSVVGESVVVNKSKISRSEQFKQKTKSFAAKLNIPKPTFRAKSVDEQTNRKDEIEDQSQKATSLISVTGTPEFSRSPEVSPRPSQKIASRQHFLTPEVTVSQEEYGGSFDTSNIFGIHIHNTDRKLKCSKLVVHPVIKVHVIDTLTGKYLKKLHPGRNVVSYYENKSCDLDGGIDYILPLMTQPCDLLKHAVSTRYQQYPRAPLWEELLLYNEDFDYFLQSKVILFFEILDFISLDSLDSSKTRKPRNQWWHRISWAFLRLVGADGRLNTEKKLRLQLFKANSLKINPECARNQTTELFEWWSRGQRNAIAGSLFVSVKVIPISQSQFKVKPSLRSLLPFQQEAGSLSKPFSSSSDKSFNGASPSETNQSNAIDEVTNQVPKMFPRIHGLPCQVPKILWKEFSAGNNKSCYSVKFSRNGSRLACGASVFAAYLSAEKRSSIFMYELPSGKFCRRVNGFHLGTIYDIDWSIDDKLIMSASNDCTVQVWPVSKAEKATSVILPHPCFIYSCKFCPSIGINQFLIFTGAFDGFIRLWSVAKCFESSSHSGSNSKEPDLLRQLDGHQGHVLSLDFKLMQLNQTESELILFSSGSTGSVILWRSSKNEERNVWDFCDWEIIKKIRIPDLKNVPINCIKVSPSSGTKLLLCCRDGRLRMIDYDLEIVVQRYPGALNFSHLIRGSMSPCGKFIFMGTEEGIVHVWKSDSGEKIHSYEDLPFKGPVTCVEYHPFEDTLAMCGLGGRTVSVCLFKHSTDQHSDLLKEKDKNQSSMSNTGGEVSLSVPTTSPRAQRNPFNKSKTVDHSSKEGGSSSRNVLKNAIRRAEVAIKMKSLES